MEDYRIEAPRWRTGRKVGRTIYMMRGDKPSDNDTLLGMMDTPALAAHVVNLHNRHVVNLHNRQGNKTKEL